MQKLCESENYVRKYGISRICNKIAGIRSKARIMFLFRVITQIRVISRFRRECFRVVRWSIKKWCQKLAKFEQFALSRLANFLSYGIYFKLKPGLFHYIILEKIKSDQGDLPYNTKKKPTTYAMEETKVADWSANV